MSLLSHKVVANRNIAAGLSPSAAMVIAENNGVWHMAVAAPNRAPVLLVLLATLVDPLVGRSTSCGDGIGSPKAGVVVLRREGAT